MAPAWLHRKITREACEELMTKAGLDEGRFLVRTRDNKPGEYVLCVVYKGKPTHHLIAKNEAGIYAINKKTFGEYNKVNRLIDALGKPGVKGWPVPLDKPVNVEGAEAEAEAPAKPAAAKPAAAAAPAEAAAPAAGKPVARKGSVKPGQNWKAGVLSKEATEKCLEKNGEYPDGHFLVRDRAGKPGEHILSVNFKGKPTHHLVTKNEEGQFVINKKTFGGHTKILMLVKALKVKQPGWPVPLTTPSAPIEDEAPAAAAAPAVSEDAEDKPAEETPVAEESAPAEETTAAAVTEPPKEAEAAAEPAAEAPTEATTEATAVEETTPAVRSVSESEEEAAAATPPNGPIEPPASHEPTIEEEEVEVARSKAAAANAYLDVQSKMSELSALQSSSTTAPTLTLMNTPVLTSTPTDGPELTFMLVRAVLNLGQRVNDAEKKLDELNNVLRSFTSHLGN